MTKKHFQKMAYALWGARPTTETTSDYIAALGQWNADVQAVASACAQSNPAFDRDRFVAACNADSYSPGMHGR